MLFAKHLDDHANLRVLIDGERVRLLMEALEGLALKVVVLRLGLAFLVAIDNLLHNNNNERRRPETAVAAAARTEHCSQQTVRSSLCGFQHVEQTR